MSGDVRARRMSRQRKLDLEMCLSDEHRKWGEDVPAADIDFLLVEYDRAEPIALIEYKHVEASLENTSDATYAAIRKLADRSGIPFFTVRWASDFALFQVVPENVLAKSKLAEVNKIGNQVLDESRYVAFLYWLRGRKKPAGIV